jgi:chemotaxis protein histidine kinase CheA
LQELVETPGGRIRVESLSGEGTKFTMTLPL